MTFGLAPGKLGFKIGDVLVGLQSGTTDTPETISSTQNKLHTIPYMWNPDTLAYEVPQQPLTDAELRAAPVPCYAYPLEHEVAHTAALNGVNARLYHIMGSRSQGWSSTSVLGDACDYLDTSQARMNTPTSGQTLYLVSTSASDAAAGVGARTVRTVYLDASGVQQVRTDTLNGTTPVSLGTGYTAIQWMEVASVGSSEVSVGNLTISSTNGAATVATTFERIAAGGDRSLSGRFKVPTGCTGHLLQWDAAAISTTMDTRLRATVFMDDATLSSVYHFLDRSFLGAGANTTFELSHLTLPAGATVKISAIPGSAPAGNKLDASFTIICMGM